MSERHQHRLRRRFGEELPRKIGNVQVSRAINGSIQGCEFCFPHGLETRNATVRKNRRSWKKHRRTQYRTH